MCDKTTPRSVLGGGPVYWTLVASRTSEPVSFVQNPGHTGFAVWSGRIGPGLHPEVNDVLHGIPIGLEFGGRLPDADHVEPVSKEALAFLAVVMGDDDEPDSPPDPDATPVETVVPMDPDNSDAAPVAKLSIRMADYWPPRRTVFGPGETPYGPGEG